MGPIAKLLAKQAGARSSSARRPRFWSPTRILSLMLANAKALELFGALQAVVLDEW